MPVSKACFNGWPSRRDDDKCCAPKITRASNADNRKPAKLTRSASPRRLAGATSRRPQQYARIRANTKTERPASQVVDIASLAVGKSGDHRRSKENSACTNSSAPTCTKPTEINRKNQRPVVRKCNSTITPAVTATSDEENSNMACTSLLLCQRAPATKGCRASIAQQAAISSLSKATSFIWNSLASLRPPVQRHQSRRGKQHITSSATTKTKKTACGIATILSVAMPHAAF